MNIFLTGNVQVGKSTILNRFISSHPDLKIGGFKTLTNFDENLGIYRGVYIVPATQFEVDYSKHSHVGTRTHKRDAYPENFDLRGVEILNSPGDYDLILMDEIGFMETRALKFNRRVLEIPDSDVPVIGVVKPMMKGLPLDVKTHPDTTVLEVTVENREYVYLEFCELMENEVLG